MIKVLTHCHSYPPAPCTGADIYVERINTFLADRGCDVRVIIDNCNEPYTHKNHRVQSNKRLIAENYEWCDAVITNLVTRNQACWIAERFNKPIFHICHNSDIATLQVKPNNYIIYNSYWLAKERPLSFPSIVVQPPTFPEDWKVDRSHAEYITLVNLTANKGAGVFYQLALSLPQFKFMGVLGGYGTQFGKPMKNINYEPFTNDMQRIYDMTKILIVPSKKESWSLAAAEAQCCGIPVICSDLPGLRENLGESAFYADGTAQYKDAILNIDRMEYSFDRTPYDYLIQKGLSNAYSKNHREQLENLYNFMLSKIKKEEKEKQDMEPVKEKVEIIPEQEKKIIRRPGRPKKIK